MLIETEFDGLLEEDVIFEETDQAMEYSDILKNSENLLKSFLYLKKLMSGASPFINRVLRMDTIDTTTGEETYLLNTLTGKVFIKNISALENYSIFFNGGEFVLFPYETLEFPIEEGTELKTKGKFSIIESEYSIGKAD